MKAKKKAETANQPVPKPDDPNQSKRFIEAAHQIEADETGEAFRREFEKIVPPKSQ